MKVSKWMNKKLHTINKQENVLKAWRMMLDYRLRHLPVLDESGKLMGILSDRDIKKHAVPMEANNNISERMKHLESMSVEQIMISRVITIASDATMEEAAEIMLTHHFDSLPVLEEGNLVGMLTSSDFLRLYTQGETEVPKALG